MDFVLNIIRILWRQQAARHTLLLEHVALHSRRQQSSYENIYNVSRHDMQQHVFAGSQILSTVTASILSLLTWEKDSLIAL
jgi:hypothetical protein